MSNSGLSSWRRRKSGFLRSASLGSESPCGSDRELILIVVESKTPAIRPSQERKMKRRLRRVTSAAALGVLSWALVLMDGSANVARRHEYKVSASNQPAPLQSEGGVSDAERARQAV